MRNKILKAELSALFIVTVFSLIFFFLEDKLPDHCLVISSRSEDAGFVSYYLTSLVAWIGHSFGVWVVFPYVLSSLAYSFLLAKRERLDDIFYIFLVYGMVGGLFYLIYPSGLGAGALLLFKVYFEKTGAAILSLLCGFLLYWLTQRKTLLPNLGIQSALLQRMEGIRALADKAQKFKFSSFFKRRIKQDLGDKEVSAKENLSTPIMLMGPTEAVEDGVNQNSVSSFKEEIVPAPLVQAELFPEGAKKIEGQKQQVTLVKNQREYPFTIQALIRCLYPIKQTRKNIASPDDSYFTDIITRLEEKLAEFKLDAKVINILKGPVVDTFELELGAGVKVSRITSITEDLSLALCGIPIRMVYPMKGKTTVGVEIPRNPREIIFLDEMLANPLFQESRNKLPIAMGKNAFGDISLVDLASMPHMLVAGSTGSGKSVFVNALLVSLLIKLPPSKLKLVLIDPKQLELALYANVPHLMLPVVTDAKAASLALLWACQEMERRYSILKELAVRNIEGFNDKVKHATTEQLRTISSHYQDKIDQRFELPYLVIIVDEFADLILTKNGKEIEANICRLAAKARAAGIHLVVATQRPSVDVITGLIKSNFPTRVSFRVTSSIDSRTILNAVGAEKLLGKGDMLYKHGIDVERLHSAFVDENEIEELVKKLSEMPQQFDQEALSFIENEGELEEEGPTRGEGPTSNLAGEDDDLYQQAVRVVMDHQMASASMLQRRLRIGYNRAANLVEEMESKGIIGPQEGSRPRKVLVSSGDGPV